MVSNALRRPTNHNTDQRLLVRQNPVHRARERLRNAEAMEMVRQGPVRRAQETDRRRLVRQDPVCREQEQNANTLRRRVVREQCPIHHEMATKFDCTSPSYLFNQLCGIWNVECRQGCGYIHVVCLLIVWQPSTCH